MVIFAIVIGIGIVICTLASMTVRICGALIIIVVEMTGHSCIDAKDMALAVDMNPVAFSGGDGKEVRIKGFIRRVGGDIIERV
jgi:hypothetical protein